MAMTQPDPSSSAAISATALLALRVNERAFATLHTGEKVAYAVASVLFVQRMLRRLSPDGRRALDHLAQPLLVELEARKEAACA